MKENKRFLLSHIMKLLLVHEGAILQMCLGVAGPRARTEPKTRSQHFGMLRQRQLCHGRVVASSSVSQDHLRRQW